MQTIKSKEEQFQSFETQSQQFDSFDAFHHFERVCVCVLGEWLGRERW